ncbi:hypothetical protein NQ317_007718 [Molorchus minor]|uniref:Protein ANTAGONIST OF LIKE HETEROCHROMATIN PROTEIN 1-like n=1 Tax=Molorchus minor TaxID=1323400 RepID=A0ABQ9IQP1_9CUCU|nr:hypothetical protein NQ317_007718 [Molorchus minor]
MDDEEFLAIAFLLSQRKKRKRRFWIHPLNTQRIQQSQFYILHPKLRAHPEKFFDYYRMSIISFNEVLNLIREDITKQDTHLRLAISAEERLAITLRNSCMTLLSAHPLCSGGGGGGSADDGGCGCG